MPYERLYTESEICDLLEMAEALGLNLDKGSPLEKMTIEDLERLLNVKRIC
jgi:hypothetical protein